MLTSAAANMPARDDSMPKRRPLSAAAKLRQFHEQTARAVEAALAKGLL